MQLLSIPFRLVSIHSAIFANMLHIRTKYSRRFPINFHACFIHSTNIYQAPKFLYARNYFMYWPFGRQSRLSCSCNFCAHFPANNLSTNSLANLLWFWAHNNFSCQCCLGCCCCCIFVSSPCSEFFFLVFCIILTSWTSVDRWQNLYFQIIEFIRKIETFLFIKNSIIFFVQSE